MAHHHHRRHYYYYHYHSCEVASIGLSLTPTLKMPKVQDTVVENLEIFFVFFFPPEFNKIISTIIIISCIF